MFSNVLYITITTDLENWFDEKIIKTCRNMKLKYTVLVHNNLFQFKYSQVSVSNFISHYITHFYQQQYQLCRERTLLFTFMLRL